MTLLFNFFFFTFIIQVFIPVPFRLNSQLFALCEILINSATSIMIRRADRRLGGSLLHFFFLFSIDRWIRFDNTTPAANSSLRQFKRNHIFTNYRRFVGNSFVNIFLTFITCKSIGAGTHPYSHRTKYNFFVDSYVNR